MHYVYSRTVPLTADGLGPSTRHHHNKFEAMSSVLSTFQEHIPPVDQKRSDPHLISAHVIYHGTVLLLHSLRADDNPDEHDRVFAAARSIVDLCSTIWTAGGTQVVRGYVLPSVSRQTGL